MTPAPAVTDILEITQLSPQFKFCKEQFITLRSKVRLKVKNLDESWRQLISILYNVHESNNVNQCQTVCYACCVLTPFLQGFKVAHIIFKKAASQGKPISHPYDKVLSPKENPIFTGIKNIFYYNIKWTRIYTDWLKEKLNRETQFLHTRCCKILIFSILAFPNTHLALIESCLKHHLKFFQVTNHSMWDNSLLVYMYKKKLRVLR